MAPPLHESLKYAARLLPVLCLFGFTPCHAENVSEQSYLQDMLVVLSASRLSQPVSEAPNAVTVVDRAMIKASGFRNIVDLFRLVPGMYVDYFNGHTPIVSYRGATDEYTRRMQVLVDGRSVYLPPFNTVDWEDLPLHMDDIERIEVVRGPAANSYGSNSVMGVISITTRDAFALNGASISATRGNAGGGNGVADAVARYGSTGEHLDYRLTFSRRADNGFDYPAGSPNWFDGYDDSSTAHHASLRVSYHPNGADNFDFHLGFSNSSRAIGDPRNKLSQPHDVENSSGHQQVNWLRTLNQGDDIQLRYYHISRNSKSENITLPVLNGETSASPLAQRYWISETITVHRHELELQHTLHTGINNRVVWGMATRYESVASPFLFLAPQNLHQSRLFAHDEWRVSPGLILNGGAMLEDAGMGHKKLSPRAALNFHATPAHTFRASVSVAYRNPAFAEESSNLRYQLDGLYQLWLSSGGLRPERTLSREIGYIGNFANGWSFDARVYNDQVSDMIWLDHNLGDPASIKLTYGFPIVLDFRNEFAARYTGFEGTAKYKWGDRKSLALNYTHQKASADPVGSVYLASTFLSGPASDWFTGYLQAFPNTVPTNSASLLYTVQAGDGISFSAGYYQQGSVMVITGNKPQPLNRRLDMRLAKQFKPAGRIGGGEVSLVVQNALRGDNVGYSGYLFDRRALVTATLNF